MTRPILGDARIGARFDDAAFTRAMIAVEQALADVQGKLGIIPAEAAFEISELSGASVSAGTLDAGVAQTGVPVPALVAAMRQYLSPGAADWLHYGATSQDIVDSAMCLCASHALADLSQSLADIIDTLHVESEAQGNVLMLARTRGQLATPITFGLRIAQWAQPLIRLENELPDLRAVVLAVQYGGASGSRSANGLDGAAISNALAAALGLSAAPPWHTDRSGFRQMSGWLLRFIQALAKFGGDLALSGRGEIAEVRAGEGGGSSTMPHKSNPVRAEALATVAHVATSCDAGLAASAIHAEERDGAMWAVEWALLPQMFELAGAAVSHAGALITDMTADTSAMQGRIDAQPAVLSEAAVFALSATLGRVKAMAAVKEALAIGASLETLLIKHLGPLGPKVLDPSRFIEPAQKVAAEIFAQRLGTQT